MGVHPVPIEKTDHRAPKGVGGSCPHGTQILFLNYLLYWRCMKKLFFAAAMVALFVLGTGLRTVGASEGDILNRLLGVDSSIRSVGAYLMGYHAEDTARFDAIETKLDRVYEACGRGTTAARRVTLAQVNSCIDACFTSAAVGLTSEGAVGRQEFISCVARCPSNTLRNIECATTYVHQSSLTGGVILLENGDPVEGGRTPAAYVRQCMSLRGQANQTACRDYADTFRSNFGTCLFDQTAYACQSDCQRNYRSDAGLIMCQLRCQSRTRAAERFERLQSAGFLTEDGRLNAGTLSNTTVAPLAPTIQAITPSTPSVSPAVPAPETYSQCVYRCDADRTACLERSVKVTECQPTYESCYMGCGSRLTGGSSR